MYCEDERMPCLPAKPKDGHDPVYNTGTVLFCSVFLDLWRMTRITSWQGFPNHEVPFPDLKDNQDITFPGGVNRLESGKTCCAVLEYAACCVVQCCIVSHYCELTECSIKVTTTIEILHFAESFSGLTHVVDFFFFNDKSDSFDEMLITR